MGSHDELRPFRKAVRLAVAIQAGRLCRLCKGGCANAPTPLLGVYLDGIDCEHCGGAGCPECRYRGTARLTQCPKKEIPEEVHNAMRLAGYARHLHYWPVGKGVLSESRMGLRMFDLIWSEQMEAEKK